MIHAALSGHHCTSVKEVSAMISCLFEKNEQFDLGATGSETVLKLQVFFLCRLSEGKRG